MLFKYIIPALLLFMMPFCAMAHKIKIFAVVNDGTASGYVYMSGGVRAAGSSLELWNMQGRQLDSLKTSGDGTFSFPSLSPGEYLIKVNSGDGHAAELKIKVLSAPAELALLKPDNLTESKNPAPDSDLKSLVAAALKEQLPLYTNPLLEKIEELEERTRFRDILGGLGWILGTGGIAAYFMSFKRKD